MRPNEKIIQAILALLAFSFLGFYIWHSYQGLSLLALCRKESAAAATAIASCAATGAENSNAHDIFFPISGVVSAVALTALGYKPETLTSVGSNVLHLRRNFDWTKLLDTMIAIYVIVWVIVGLIVLAKTATLSPAQATTWKLEWLRNFGRIWVSSALTVVALWLGVPKGQGAKHSG